jgi:hypothetical protein
MCAHSSSGEEITERISRKLYPFIDSLFQEAIDFTFNNPIQNDTEAGILDLFYLLKSEFNSLRNYELKLVFPSVLKVFNTKDNRDNKPSLDIVGLQFLTKKKEAIIIDYVRQIEEDVEKMQLAKDHPIFPLLLAFQTSFVEEKKLWNSMLNGWSTGCACFVSAQLNNELSSQK